MPAPEAMDALFLQLEFGIPRRALPLLSLPGTLTRPEYLELCATGLTEPGLSGRCQKTIYSSKSQQASLPSCNLCVLGERQVVLRPASTFS